MIAAVRTLWRDEEGVSAVEHALLLVLVVGLAAALCHQVVGRVRAITVDASGAFDQAETTGRVQATSAGVQHVPRRHP